MGAVFTPAWSDSSFRAMGTKARVLSLGGPPDLASRARVMLARLEHRWSRFIPDSELCLLNAAAGSRVVVSDQTFELLTHAVDSWTATDGYFDPTVYDAIEGIGYDRDFSAVVTADPGRPAHLSGPTPGCGGIELDRLVRSVRLPVGVRLDLGGIGKGYAADCVAAQLLDEGAEGVCVDLGGDLYVAGRAPHPDGWQVIGDATIGADAVGTIRLAAGGVATSTRLRRRWRIDGRNVHHLIDPRSGRPASTGLAAVTVIAGTTWRAEVLAKAAFVAGLDEGPQLIANAGATGLLLTDDDRVIELDGLSDFHADRSGAVVRTRSPDRDVKPVGGQ